MELKIARIRKGLTQRGLAEMVGMSPMTIVRMEKGNYDSLRLGQLKKIAAALESTVSELFLS